MAGLNSPYYNIPSGNNTLVCSYIPLNMPKDALMYYKYVPDASAYTKPTDGSWFRPVNNTAVLQFTLSSLMVNDVTETINNSGFFQYSTPTKLVQLPSLSSNFLQKIINFSLYGLDPYNIFLNSMAYNTKSIGVGFGLFSGQDQLTLNGFTVIGNNLSPSDNQISYITSSSQYASTEIKIYKTALSSINTLKANDTISIIANNYFQYFLVKTTPIKSGNIWTISVSALGDAGTFGTISGLVSIYIYIYKTLNSPYILQDTLGMHLINIGTSKNELYLSSFQSTGKTWKYVIDINYPVLSTSLLRFDTNVNVPQPPSTNNFAVNACLFNTNNSSITLTPSTQTPGEWVLISSTGNNGFSLI